jgi:sporulation protein YlmC with PRC-barrel domain
MDHERRTHKDWIGRDLFDRYGDKIGEITDIYLDDATGDAEWMTVSTGWFGTREQFVPIVGTRAHGDDLQVDWDVDVIKDAPSVEPDEGHLDPAEERRLYQHYGFDPSARDRAGTYGTRDRADADFTSGRSTGEAPAEPTWEPGSPRLKRRTIDDDTAIRHEGETHRRM